MAAGMKKRRLHYYFRNESASQEKHVYLNPLGGELFQKKAKMRRTRDRLGKEYSHAKFEMIR